MLCCCQLVSAASSPSSCPLANPKQQDAGDHACAPRVWWLPAQPGCVLRVWCGQQALRGRPGPAAGGACGGGQAGGCAAQTHCGCVCVWREWVKTGSCAFCQPLVVMHAHVAHQHSPLVCLSFSVVIYPPRPALSLYINCAPCHILCCLCPPPMQMRCWMVTTATPVTAASSAAGPSAGEESVLMCHERLAPQQIRQHQYLKRLSLCTLDKAATAVWQLLRVAHRSCYKVCLIMTLPPTLSSLPAAPN